MSNVGSLIQVYNPTGLGCIFKRVNVEIPRNFWQLRVEICFQLRFTVCKTKPWCL